VTHFGCLKCIDVVMNCAVRLPRTYLQYMCYRAVLRKK
jgi:hypothetical protein